MKKRILIILCAVLILSLGAFCLTACNEEEKVPVMRDPVIKTQPSSVDINYPDGANFKVEVERPEDVATYQWQEWLKGYGYEEIWNDMDGISAKTNELVIKSFNCECFSCKFRCVVTNKNGKQVISNEASVNVLNRESEFIPYVIVGEYGVKDGETLDLSDTPYGTGEVSFNVEGNDGIITLDNVNYSNEKVISSSIFSSVAFELLSRTNTLDKYVFKLVGNNKIKNVLYEEELNAAGIPICSNFLNGCPVKPMIEVSGDGFLDIEGGSEMIYSNTSLTVDAKLRMKGTLDIWANGFKARKGIVLGKNCVIDCNDFNGSVVNGDDTDFEPCDLTIEKGAAIRGRIFAGKVGAGATQFYGFKVHGDMDIEGVNINLTMVTDANRFIPDHEYVSVSSAFSANKITVKDSSIVIDYDFTEGQDQDYCGSYTGFDADSSLSIESSFVRIKMDSPSLLDARGIAAHELTVNSSNIDLTVKARGFVYGINVHNSTNDAVATFNNSKVKIDAKSYDDEIEIVYGLKCEGLDLDFVYETNSLEVDSNGISLAVFVEQAAGGDWQYQEGYVPVRINAKNVKVSLPDGGSINQATIISKPNVRYETVYDADKTTVSSHFILGYDA